MPSIFQRFRDGFQKTAQRLVGSLGGVFGRKELDASSLDEMEEALYEADFGVATTEEILDEIRAAYRQDKSLRGEEAAAIGAHVLARVLEGSEGHLEISSGTPEQPLVIALLGVNGSGKTTTTAKLGHRLQEAGHPVVLGACDTFRAAANEQIRAWSEKLGLELVSSHHGADPAAVAFDAWQAAKGRGRHAVLLDTAGRLHTKDNLMKELQKLRRVLQKHDETAPQHAWIVVDGSLGSNSLEQARVFHESFGLTGVVVTKLDGTSRGGALVAIYRELKLPIYFIGLGEKAEDLQPFDAQAYARAVFGLEATPAQAR